MDGFAGVARVVDKKGAEVFGKADSDMDSFSVALEAKTAGQADPFLGNYETKGWNLLLLGDLFAFRVISLDEEHRLLSTSQSVMENCD